MNIKLKFHNKIKSLLEYMKCDDALIEIVYPIDMKVESYMFELRYSNNKKKIKYGINNEEDRRINSIIDYLYEKNTVVILHFKLNQFYNDKNIYKICAFRIYDDGGLDDFTVDDMLYIFFNDTNIKENVVLFDLNGNEKVWFD